MQTTTHAAGACVNSQAGCLRRCIHMQTDGAERNKETVGSLLTCFCFSLSSRRKLFEESSLSKPSPIKSPPRCDARTVSSLTCFRDIKGCC